MEEITQAILKTMEVKPLEAGCQEASIHSRETFLACGAPASAIVWHPRERRAYLMCAARPQLPDQHRLAVAHVVLATEVFGLCERGGGPNCSRRRRCLNRRNLLFADKKKGQDASTSWPCRSLQSTARE